MSAPRVRTGWHVRASSGPAYFVCILDRDHLVHLVASIPCGTRCGSVLDSRDRWRLTMRREVFDDEACPICWAPFHPPAEVVDP